MDGRGRFRDNTLVGRLWRSLKYEEVYLKAYQNVAEARGSASLPTLNFTTTSVCTRLSGLPRPAPGLRGSAAGYQS